MRIREWYGRYQGQVEGQPPGPPSRICLPHIKGSTPDKDTTPTESELTGSEHGGSDLEESREALEEGEVQEDYTGIQSRKTDTDDRLREAPEAAVPSTPRPRGQGKRRADRGRGSTKKPRLESSSSDRWEESEGSTSTSGSTQGRLGRGGQRADRPRTPPPRPLPQGASPLRSPQLYRPAHTEDFRKLPLSPKPSISRMAHSRSASEDERGRHASRSPSSSSKKHVQ